MHLKSSRCSSLFVRTCSGNHGNISRLPLGVLYTNTLRLKAPPPLQLYQTAGEDADAPLDIWTVIKPGHVREKIAIFASDGGGSSDRTPSGSSRAGKAKGSREENCRSKRRRRSGSNRNLQQDANTRVRDTRQPSPRRSGGGLRDGEAVKTTAEEQKVSVVEMVAFLEQRKSERQPDSKPPIALQRSSASITLSRAPPLEVKWEEPESVRVSDMVAKLESECLKRSTEGDLSRSSSLRRTVGRVLLAAGDQSPAPCRPSSPSSSLSQSVGREPISYSEPALTTPPSGEAQGAPPPEEPLPGLLFLSASQPRPSTARRDSGSQSERRAADGASEEEEEVAGVTLCRSASVSQDFLSLRRRLQRLLEPRPLLAALPPHLLLRVLLLLPTRSLAALKCSCRYFLFVIDHYGVRPADSLWVSDPRYRDDPCKQCKRRGGGGGDVTPCRWHHKPYCQAMPGGPGFWMCCRGARRDAPGCNVGLHDNRWVPAFHSINAPIYRRGRHDD
ncbi:F-box only protein 34 [Cyclopterus lumpus]|uniref:F-box only protein 34 n=1 Tax=Cyclopterus lumpus TaxID=8103 RepID=UPI00148688B0|nr:F-box only protein 34 [Cyclopterus lumpus]